ncbi:MAG: hypothetical protein LBF40_06920 [Deltaproteobacteria bacterium]|jgi:uncharacterized Zn finger protein|nr:hypothetical protein [Deltaproteobacteria bacterium]
MSYGFPGWGRSSRFFSPRPKVNKEKFKKGKTDLQPVEITGRTIAKTFWGEQWCSHFESMADYENRIPRGRTYARNGSIVDLRIEAGKVLATVAGSDFYSVVMDILPLPVEKWENIKSKCQGEIATMVDLLMGRFSSDIMKVVCDPEIGMFPKDSEISYKCSCPDWAKLCKHISSVFYGIGNRLDESPELLFLLRRVNPLELFDGSAKKLSERADKPRANVLEGDLSSIFGVDIVTELPTGLAPAGKKDKTPKGAKAPKESKGLKTAKAGKAEKPKTVKKSDPSSERRPTDEELKQIITRISDDKKGQTESVKRPGMNPDFDNITADEFKKLRKYCRMDINEFAKSLGVSGCCIRRWENLSGRINASPKSVSKMKDWWSKMR